MELFAMSLATTGALFADRNGSGRIELQCELPGQPDYTEIIQENHYYPFGLEMTGPWAPPQTQPANFYRY
ncbi:MAG: hypothetical protein D6732_23710 [Methanobacteriota archaeon]|nr:MAG: hypothetical protein D6732_23710 [Euryarchaeota archaeon]